MSSLVTKRSRGFTGWHMLAVLLLFFGTIFTANALMAWNASRSWSGLVVQNTYIASQQFNTKVAEAERLAASGIEGRVETASGQFRYVLLQDGKPLPAADRVLASFKRPVEEHEDFEIELDRTADGVFVAGRSLKKGQWIADLRILDGEETIYRQAVRFIATGDGK